MKADIYQAGAERYVQGQLASFDRLLAEIDHRSFDARELSEIVQTVNFWAERGAKVWPVSVAWRLAGCAEEEDRAFWRQAVTAGWMPLTFISSEKDAIEVRIVKHSVGTSLLGKSKWRYFLARCDEDSGVFRVWAELPSVPKALDRMASLLGLPSPRCG